MHDEHTAAAVRTVETAPNGLTDKELVDLAVLGSLVELGHGWIDSHALAKAVFAYRYDPRGSLGDQDQKRDYVQHLLRETEHVCRYADTGHYRVHEAKRCSPECAQHRYRPQPIQAPLCPSCFIRLPLDGSECPFCG